MVIATLFLLLGVFAHVGSAENQKKPNILLFVADDMGYGDTSLSGNPTIETPNLERLAHGGTQFTQFTAAASICSPSRASMLTGRLPIRTGVYADLGYPLDNFFRVFYPSSKECLPESETTLGEALEGYRTSMIGKWHIGHNPAGNNGNGCLPGNGRQGFDFFFGLPYSHEEGYPGPFPEGLVFPPVPLFLQDQFVEQPFNSSDLTSRYTDIAQYIIGDEEPARQRLQAASLEKPFFLHVAYENPHVPLFLSDDYEESCKPSRRGLYGDSVSEMDASIGKILDALEATGKADDTIVIFTSDNGAWVDPSNGLNPNRPTKGMGPYDGGSNAPFKGGKGDTNEGGFRVPMIMKVPPKLLGGQKMRRVERTPVNMMDLFPTLLDLASLPLPAGVELDGLSMRPLLEGTLQGELHDCLYYWRERDLYAIRCGPHKAHFITRSGFNTSDPGTVNDPPLLYNVEWDTAERIPLDPSVQENAETLVQLQAAADKHLAEIERVKAKSLYLPQAVRVMPCCPRGSSNGVITGEEMPSPDLEMPWHECICHRE
eukprot:GSChrysophyteH1.ASY1.ANO1.1597.1 assembled CDS